MVADDEYLMKEKIRNSYNGLVGKHPTFLWPRVNGRKLNSVGKLDLNVTDPEFIVNPTHWIKAVHKPIFALASNPKKDNPLGFHMSNNLHINNYWG